jgi:Spy/CpxP family protein refolding chaperone
MIRWIALAWTVALASAGLGTLSASAWAADPADKPAKRPETRLWWNDPTVVEKLSLTGDQRAEMDELFETYRNTRKSSAAASGLPTGFYQALEQGDADRARTALASWAETERARIQTMGDLKIGVISLLSEAQRKTLASAHPPLIRQVWTPRASWEPRPPRQPQKKKKRAN